jgi:4-hydroxybutyrate CoA-transferase
MIITTPELAVEQISSNQHLFIHSAAAVPQILIDALCKRYRELKNVSIYSMHTEGKALYAEEKYQEAFHLKPFFVGQNIRENIQAGRGSYIPVFLSEAPSLFRKGIIPLDVALLSVSPPDEHGFCTLGPSVDISLAAAQSAKMIIAQINPQIPRTHGDGFIHVSKINYAIESNSALPIM